MNFYSRIYRITKINYCARSIPPRTDLLPTRYAQNQTYYDQCNYLSTTNTFFSKKEYKDGFLKSLLLKLPFVDISKSRLKVTGYILYESVADKINYADFFKQYSLPDTFYSWFVITELHVWMLLVRAMSEGKDGRYTRNCIVQALWADATTRAKKLGVGLHMNSDILWREIQIFMQANPSGIRMQIDELSQQFQAALIAYDEGLLSNDKVLASALWRRIFQQNCDSPEHLEALVQYVRKQMKVFDELTTDELLVKRQISWIPLKCK